MAADTPLTAEQIEHDLDVCLELEFTFLNIGEISQLLSVQSREEQEFLLGWTRRIATTNIQIAYQFLRRAPDLLKRMDRRVMETWALHAMDTYDRVGLHAAMQIIRDVNQFMQHKHAHAAAAVFDDVRGILLNFVHGLSGRTLKLEQGNAAYTDSETLYLPAVIAQLPDANDNFSLSKAMVAMLWAQTRYGTFQVDISQALHAYPDEHHALQLFHSLETLRLEACIQRELPGLFRDMQGLKSALGQTNTPVWSSYAEQLANPECTARDCFFLLESAYHGPLPDPICYQGELRPGAIAACMTARVEREKALFRIKLAQLASDAGRIPDEANASPRPFEIREAQASLASLPSLELVLDDIPVAPPDDVRQLMTSIQLDLGNIPDEYLVPAGPGEYDSMLIEEKTIDPNEVWQGTYHEEGAFFYPEWDFGRQHYRKNWCVMREREVTPVYDEFVTQTKQKHAGLLKLLRKTFEALRDENRMLKRQAQGDEIDIDALVEALADASDGSEMSDRLFIRTHRSERNIAVMFMVDMSGSTRGWINDAERESLVLLCETLETLGDRYAIYGFSGTTRKRCELYRIKQMDEPYNDTVRARISGIRPQDYTRMGFAIRHLSKLLQGVEARTKLLITLSDGRPDDYNDNYRGRYGIEDTRQALIEAKCLGIHPFCITIDQEAREYLPHMYGAVNYTVIDEVPKLPLKVAGIYRRLTM
ncbi:MAG: hypothetical protein ACYC2R_04735 [Burkholderiales bacterium]